MYKLGLIGCGNWAQTVSNEILKNNKFKLEAVVCRKKNSFLNTNNKISIYQNFKSMLDSKNLDCLYVAANPNVNKQVFNYIKDKKIPIILEKPLANNYRECLNIINFLKKNKFSVFTNLPNIYSDNFIKTKEYIKKNKKNIKKIIIYEGSFGPFRKNTHPIIDWGIHSFTLILKLFDDDKILNIQNKQIKKNYNNNALVSKFNITFESGINVKLVTGNLFKKKIRLFKIYLNNGEIFSSNLVKHAIYINNSLIFQSKKTPLRLLLSKFYNSLNKGYNDDDFQNILISADSIKIFNNYY